MCLHLALSISLKAYTKVLGSRAKMEEEQDLHSHTEWWYHMSSHVKQLVRKDRKTRAKTRILREGTRAIATFSKLFILLCSL